MKFIDNYFKITELGSSFKTETKAGIATFLSMLYIVIVHPKILEAAGMPFEASVAATIYAAFIGTFLMGVYAKRPFAIAPYMGENAFIAYTVVNVLGYTWQQALAAIFVSGIVFTLLTIFGIRKWLAHSIPESLRISFTVGIGLFLTFIGLNETGIIILGIPGAPVHIGDFTETSVLLAIFGFILIGVLMVLKNRAAIIIGIVVVTALSLILGINFLPDEYISTPPDISNVFLHLDFHGLLSWGFIPIVITVLVVDFVDTMRTLLGLAEKANLLDKEGNLPDEGKPMLCDALATVVASLLGTTTTGTFVESASGIEKGGKTGFTAIVTSILFLVALFFTPIYSIVPAYAFGIVLIIIGMTMLAPIAKINFDDLTELIPAFTVIILMSFTYNMGIGMTAGFIIYPLIKLISGKYNEIPGGIWIFSILSFLFYVFYPY